MNIAIAAVEANSHERTAKMLIYLSALLSGTENPFWPHALLIFVSVVAGVAVGAGIIFESHKYSPRTNCIATALVIAGVVIESLCTVSLFVIDEAISRSQQTTIEQLLGHRHLSSEQTTSLIGVTKKFPSMSFVTITVADDESWGFGIEIGRLLRSNGWNWLPCDGPLSKLQGTDPTVPLFCWTIVTGIQIDGSKNRRDAVYSLVDALKDPAVIGMENVRPEISEAFPTIAIMVGTKR